MAINIQISKAKKEVTIELKARRTLDGNVLIFDHEEIDIAILVNESKVIAFPKKTLTDSTYDSESRLFDFLRGKGIIELNTIQGGNLYGSLEGVIATPSDEDINSIDYTLYNIYKFLKEEKPYFDYIEDYEEMLDDYFVDPTTEDSTELGEVPQAAEKGSIRPGYNYAPYWMSYMLEEARKKKK
tara:strand:+ start:1281 stop:1832 length:552 start_codon:yes stop_codon:yes gene_type:complete